MSPEWLLLFGLIGALGGLLAGLLGVGGGLIMVPALLYSFRQAGFAEEVVLHLALGTSLAVIVFNAIASVWAHHRRAAVLWPIVSHLTPGLVLGTLLGALLAAQMNTPWLQRLFGLFAIGVGMQMVLMVHAQGRYPLPARLGQSLAGGVIGMVSALVGIGGGSMTVPYLSACRVEMRRAVATSAACGLPIALAGSLGYAWTGWGHPALPSHSLGFIHWPALVGIALVGMLFAPLGARWAHRLPVQMLKRLFGLLLLVLGARMLVSVGI